MDTRFLHRCLLAAATAICTAHLPAARADDGAIQLILVGDSTLAPRNGYGDALCQRFKPGVACLNLARNGRSSGSYRAEGSWDAVMDRLRETKGHRATYVLIEFGHNDQPGKPGRSTDLAREFPLNVARYAADVESQGAFPVLATPLTRRFFRDGVLQNDLVPWADATRRVAREKHLPLLDLNADSAAAVATMGAAEADTLAAAPPPGASPVPADPAGRAQVETSGDAPAKFDHTHLGAKGARYFARMAAEELRLAVPALAAQLKPDTEDK